MENNGLKTFAISFGMTVFVIILLGVMRLPRLAFIAFGLSGLVFLIWGIFLAKNDDEIEQEVEKETLPKAKTPLQKKLAKKLENAKNEINSRKKRISELEEKSAYFIKQVYGKHLSKTELSRHIFLTYEEIKKEHRSKISNPLHDNCEKIVLQHRSEIELLTSEIFYWQTLDKKYNGAFHAIVSAQTKIDELEKMLKTKEQRISKEERLNREMQEYLDANFSQEKDKLQDAIYQNMSFGELRSEIKGQLEELEKEINTTTHKIEQAENVTANYYEIKKQLDSPKANIDYDLAEEIRRLSKELEDL